MEALSFVERVKKTRRVEILRPMRAYERRIIHIAVKEVGEGLATQSVGVEPNRRVIIKPEE
jgi:predicted RNA-binding protein Jag